MFSNKYLVKFEAVVKCVAIYNNNNNNNYSQFISLHLYLLLVLYLQLHILHNNSVMQFSHSIVDSSMFFSTQSLHENLYIRNWTYPNLLIMFVLYYNLLLSSVSTGFM